MHAKGTFIFLFDWIVTFETRPLYKTLFYRIVTSVSRALLVFFLFGVSS